MSNVLENPHLKKSPTSTLEGDEAVSKRARRMLMIALEEETTSFLERHRPASGIAGGRRPPVRAATTPPRVMETGVCIIGAGPAGIMLAHLLRQNDIDCIIVDRHDRQEIFERGRAGILEHRTVQLLREHGLDAKLVTMWRQRNRCEFRSPDGSIMFDYGRILGGICHVSIPQNELVWDLQQQYLEIGHTIHFNVEALAIQNCDHPSVECRDHDGARLQIRCRYIAGCDGYRGVARASLPAGAVQAYQRRHEYNWLGILAKAPPSSEHVIYALHPRGWAGNMPRNAKISRYYLQVPAGDTVDDWPDQRVWSELRVRLAKNHWTLMEGQITEKRMLPLRSYVSTPMHHQRLFLAGDAAHLFVPCGGKGMNMAIQDAVVLAQALIECSRKGHSNAAVDEYSRRRLPAVWKAQQFSYSMMELLHRSPSEPDDGHFVQQLKASVLEQLASPTPFAIDFARKYVGYIEYDEETLRTGQY